MTQNQTSKSRSSNYGKINALTQLVCYRLEDLFEKLEIDLRRSGKLFIGCCPIHQGDNYSALNLYPDGESVPGIWQCNTRKCHWVFKNTIIGFVRGVLSQKYFSWESDRPEENMAPFDKVLKWLCQFIGKRWNQIQVDDRTIEINKFANQMATFKTLSAKKEGLSHNTIKKHLQIPAEYYIKRGYQPQTLADFNVGLCTASGKEMYNRVVVPIFDESGKHMICCSGRSIYEKCPECSLYHCTTDKCPSKDNAKKFTKWRHSGNTGGVLYNYWNAKTHIRDTGAAVLVEGPGDVWRLHEAGIMNAVGMLGSDLTDEQQIILERSGAMKLYVIRDNDAAGEIAAQKLHEQLCRLYKLEFYCPSSVKDVGEMNILQVKQEILPWVKKKS